VRSLDGQAPEVTRRSDDCWTTVDGLCVYARVEHPLASAAPAACPVILVHGAFISSRYMVPVAARLGAHYTVYAPDLPGYGRSDRPARVPTVAGFSDVLAHWIDAVGIVRAAFMGNSFGCQIVADLAVRYPTRVARAVLIGPTVDPAHHTLLQQGARLLLDGAREPGRYLALLLGDCIKIGPREGAQLVRVVLADRIEDNLPQVRVPTLVVRGARDPLVPPPGDPGITRLLPAAQLVVVPGAAHVAHYDAPDRVMRLVRPFLGAADGSDDG